MRVSLLPAALLCALPLRAGGGEARLLRFGFTVVNAAATPSGEGALWTFAPARETSGQRCLSVTASEPFETTEDAWGNQVLHFKIAPLPPHGRRLIRIEARVESFSSPRRERLPAARRASFLAPDALVESTHPDILALAAGLRGKTPSATAGRILEWISRRVSPAPADPAAHGALAVLAVGRGDCTDQSHLFLALVRAAGIPARLASGHVSPGGAALDPATFHDWAEYEDGGRWVTADPSRRGAPAAPSDYLAFRIAPAAGGAGDDFHRFKFAGEGLSVRVNNGSDT